jgi:hypothetical protein
LISASGGRGAILPLPDRPAHPESAAMKRIHAIIWPKVLLNMFSLAFEKRIFPVRAGRNGNHVELYLHIYCVSKWKIHPGPDFQKGKIC